MPSPSALPFPALLLAPSQPSRLLAAARALLLALILLPGLAAAMAPVSQRVDVALDPATRALRGQSEIVVRGKAAFDLILNARFQPGMLEIDGRPLQGAPRREGGIVRWRVPAGAAERRLTLSWQGPLAPLVAGQEHRDTLGQREPVADPQGSFLPAASAWYPLVLREGGPLLHDFRVTLELPEGQRGLVAGTLLRESTTDGRTKAEFEFAHPSEGIDLMAGPYRVQERTANSADGRRIALRTYFHPELEPLAVDYLDSVGSYLALYEAWIGPYPFESFSVVSSPTPTGFGMPSLTYLGIDVLKLPFIRATSLGHEVLHNWWGNGVYPAYGAGNWSEGLTTFMADYAYAERESAEKARAMRLGWLRDLSGIPPEADQPLAAFTSRRHGISQAVGYGKAAMLFLMLRERIGAEAFDRGVQGFWQAQRFRVAGWDELRAAFQAASGEDLRPFFKQWLERKGLPQLSLADARYAEGALTVKITQAAPPYELDIPLRVDTAKGPVEHRVRLAKREQAFRIALDAAPTRVTLDPESLLARRLARNEAPPILRELQLDAASEVLLLGDAAFMEAARPLAARMFDHAPKLRPADAAPGAAPLMVIGPQEAITAWLARHGLPAAPPEVAGQGDSRMWTTRQPSGAPLALIGADSAAALAAASRPLPHYRQQSWLVLSGGKAAARGVWPAQAPSIAVDRP